VRYYGNIKARTGVSFLVSDRRGAMKNTVIAAVFLALSPLAASADVSKEDLKKLAAAGVGDEVIFGFIRSNGPVARLSADDLVELKQAGAGEKLLAVLAGGSAPPARPQSGEKQGDRGTERAASAAPPTYVYETPTYYTNYYPYYSPSYYYGYYPRYYNPYCGPRFGVGFYGGRSRWSVGFRW
jgi:hypothetical protein